MYKKFSLNNKLNGFGEIIFFIINKGLNLTLNKQLSILNKIYEIIGIVNKYIFLIFNVFKDFIKIGIAKVIKILINKNNRYQNLVIEIIKKIMIK